MNKQERTNIIMDIINYHQNSDNSEFESKEQIIEKLSTVSDKQLYITWDISVGQFVENLDIWESDEYEVSNKKVWYDRGYSSVWDWQFYKIKRTGSPDYNFENPVYQKPYTKQNL